jgi:hypothetical protein
MTADAQGGKTKVFVMAAQVSEPRDGSTKHHYASGNACRLDTFPRLLRHHYLSIRCAEVMDWLKACLTSYQSCIAFLIRS